MKENRTYTSTANQRSSILTHLNEKGSATTQEFRNVGIMSPAPRIKELRELGHKIKTTFESVIDQAGIEHSKVARYSIQGGAS
jgi:hypothetical protein